VVAASCNFQDMATAGNLGRHGKLALVVCAPSRYIASSSLSACALPYGRRRLRSHEQRVPVNTPRWNELHAP
jgi:hypothetical protein